MILSQERHICGMEPSGPDFGKWVEGQCIAPPPPVICGLDEGHAGAHAFELPDNPALSTTMYRQLIANAAALNNMSVTWELQSGGPGGWTAPVFHPVTPPAPNP